MVLKLMKYDMRSNLRTLMPIWIAIVFMSVLYGITQGSKTPSGTFAHFLLLVLPVIILTLLLGISFAIAVVNMVRNFWNGLLGNEGYLMFTLPVTVDALLLSKALSALLIELMTLAVAFVSGGILAAFMVSWESFFIEFRNLWGIFWRGIEAHPNVVPTVFIVCVGILLWILNLNLHTYLACAIGHMAKKLRKLLAIIAFCSLSIATSYCIPRIVGELDALLNMSEPLVASAVFAAIPLLFNVLFFFLTRSILAHRLNLE